MRDAGIEFREVWKKYRRGEMHDSLRDLVPALVRRAVRLQPSADVLQAGDFWALRDVSFTVVPGQTLGIIGANGAGKSTVLKALTKIIRPTRGSCSVRGRIGALIEVAAGFHPDLTGRENVFLQGAIMGMSAAQTRAKFDQIVEFAGVGEFIDTPVKRYSSGMSARLGFSIAAHLDPDVLVIDEILSVGDFTFQERAFGRIRSLARSGMPVVLVSHQLDRVAELCTEALLIERGRVACQGSPDDCIGMYLSGGTAGDGTRDASVTGEPVALHTLHLRESSPVRSGDVIGLRVSGTVADALLPGTLEPVSFSVRSATTGHVVFASSSACCGIDLNGAGRFTLELELQMNVPAGVYVVETSVGDQLHGRGARGGPAVNVCVTDGTGFVGVAQLNPVMRLAEVRLPASAWGPPTA